MSAGGSVDTWHGHLAPCIPRTDKLIAKQGQVHAKLQRQPFLASVVDMVIMLTASQKTSWPTSFLVIPSSGRHVLAQQKSRQFVYTTPAPHTNTRHPGRPGPAPSAVWAGGMFPSRIVSFVSFLMHT